MTDEQSFYVQFSRFEDLVRLVAFSATPFLQHAEIEGKHVYFFHSSLLTGKPVIYYVLLENRVESKYVVYNRFSDSLSFSDKMEADGQSVYIPILEVERTNLLKLVVSTL